MRVTGIIGYKGSGKTSLLVNLARELASRSWSISSVKHASCVLDLPSTDTAMHRQFVHQTAAIAPNEAVVFFQGSKNLEQMLSYLEADFILIEGFKKEKTYPKIVCLKQDDDLETLMDGLEICVVGSYSGGKINVPILDAKDDISKIADLVEEKAFKLPNLNCGACGYETCYELALQIVHRNKTINDCCALNAEVQIKINDQVLSLNPFVSSLLKNTITGMLSSLKGYRKGRIEVHITMPGKER